MDNKKKRIPVIPEHRLDKTQAKTVLGNTKQDKDFEAFVKGKVKIQSFTTRLPVELYEKLRFKAFQQRTKINKIIVTLVEAYLKDD